MVIYSNLIDYYIRYGWLITKCMDLRSSRGLKDDVKDVNKMKDFISEIIQMDLPEVTIEDIEPGGLATISNEENKTVYKLRIQKDFYESAESNQVLKFLPMK